MVEKSFIGKTPIGEPIYRIASSIYKENNYELIKLEDEDLKEIFDASGNDEECFCLGDAFDITDDEEEFDPAERWDNLETQLYGNQKG